jgi:hypothetical protein
MAADNGLCIPSNILTLCESTIDYGVLCKITAMETMDFRTCNAVVHN